MYADSLNGVLFKRYYNSSVDGSGDIGPGWSHSYTRSVKPTLNSTPYKPWPSGSRSSSGLYSDPASACVSGFASIRSSVSAWQSATASYSSGVCSIQSGASTIGTVEVFSTLSLAPLPAPVGFNVTRDDGQVVRFLVSGGTLVAPAGTTLRLVQTSNGFTVTDESDTVEAYNSSGILQSVTNRSGVVQTAGYDTNGRLSSVTDSFGNAIVIGRDGQGRVSTVTPTGSPAVQYGYDAQGRLSTVTNSDGTSRTYLYENISFPNALTGVLDESVSRYSTWGYDTSGKATSAQEAGGANSVSVVYNSFESATVTDALGAVRTFTYTRVGDREPPASINGSQCPTCREPKGTSYDVAGFVGSRTDYNGNVTCYANDAARGLELVRVEGFPSGSVCPSNLSTYTPVAGTRQRKITTSWKPNFRVPDTITEANRTTVFTYDAAGNTLTKKVTDTSVTPNVSRTWTYTYNSFGKVLTADGPRTDVVDKSTYTYYTCTTGYQCGQANTLTNAAGQVTTYNTYNAHGQPLTITDPNGVVTTLTYDLRQRLKTRQVGTETTTFDYYPTGPLQKVTLPDGSFVQYIYDNAHRLSKITDGLGNHVDYALDAMGNRTGESAYDPLSVLSRTRSRVFNTLSQLYQDVGSAGTAAVTTTYGYDSNGNQTTIAAPMGRNTTNQYDELSRLKQITDPGSGNTLFGYDANDNLLSVTDPRSLVTSYTYTGFGDLKTQGSPDTGNTTNTYDSGGNLKTSTDGRGAITTYTYDPLNRVKTAAYKLGTTTDQTNTYTYDSGTNGLGRLTGATSGAPSMGWAYDAQGRVLSKSQTAGTITKTVGYAFTNGNLTTLTTPSGQSVMYGYSNGRVSQISVNGTTVLSNVTYEPFGPVRGWTWGNGTTLSRLHNTDGNASQINSAEVMSFGYDNAFRLNTYTNTTVPGASATYGYDLLDRLSTAGGNAGSYGWTYDANGNRLTQTGVALTVTIDPASNRMTSTTGARSTTYGYDGAGNTLTYSGNTFVYKNNGRINTATVAGSTTTYLYNALGQRIKKSGGVAGTVLYMYDESGHLLGEYNGTGGLVQETIWLGDIPVATLRPGTPVAINYVHTNHLNTPMAVTRPSDNKLRWQWHPDAFGVGAPNENPQALGAFKYNLRFPGQYYDQETGQYYNYFRDYDSQVGRYIESDRVGLLGGSFSTYSYVSNSPIFYIDPFGLCWFYYQSTGLMLHADADGYVDYSSSGGYSGYGVGYKNNPAMQGVQAQQRGDPAGPIPQGSYYIGPLRDSANTGPDVLDLTPMPGTDTFGRDLLEIHGERKKGARGNASTGCIIEPPKVRRKIANSKDNCLKVVP